MERVEIRMLYEKNSSKKLDMELFRKPSGEYRAVPFWSWNCRVTRELIDRQLLIFREMGFGGVDIHPRSGMDTAYLSEEYLELVGYTVLKCKELGLSCWLYDEDRFPSGSAGGIVTKNFRLRGRFLLVTQTERGQQEGYYNTKEAFEEAIDRGEKPAGYYAAAYGLSLREGRLTSYERLYTGEEREHAVKQGQTVRFAYVKMMEEEAWFEDQAYADTMNPEAVAEFIRVTHEAYYRYVGGEFGAVVPAIFTDEPRLGKHPQLAAADSGEDVTLPYTEHMAAKMISLKGVDPLDIVPEYIWNLAGDKFSENRYLYRDFASECFVSAYMDQICDWCGMHHIAMTGHVLSEESLTSQAFALGDCMRCYRNMDLPGIDILADRREFATAKQAVSVSRQNGREGTVSELYGVTHWDCSFKTFKLQGDWQAALGITVRIPHLSHMSLEGEAKRDWPGSIFFHAPWYQEYPYIEDHFARLNTVMTRGKAMVSIGVIHPIESFWMYLGPDDQTADIRKEMDEDFSNLIKWLLFGTLDFDFLSEALLPDQCGGFGENPSNGLKVGEMNYQAVIVPDMITIRSTTLKLLETFRERGGKIIFLGRLPVMVDGHYSDRAQKLASECIHIGKSRSDLYRELESERNVEIRRENGLYSDNLFYQLRQDNTCRWLYVCHVEHKEQHVSAMESYFIKVKGSYTVTLFDTLTGEKHAQPAVWDGEYTVIACGMYGEDSVLYRLEEMMRPAGGTDITHESVKSGSLPVPAQKRFCKIASLTKAEGWHRLEPNALLLDYAQYRLDGGELQEREEILRLDNCIRRKLGFIIREGRMNQPYHMEKRETHSVTLYYQIKSRISTGVSLAIENLENSRIWLNGTEADKTVTGHYVDHSIPVIALPPLSAGENTLAVQVAYHQKTNLENLFILGDFDVELNGIDAVITKKRDSLYLGDITRQGMPFYTGSLEYEFTFETEDTASEYYIRIPHFKAPLLAVCLDGGQEQLIAYAPHRASLGRLKKGRHKVVITVFGNRFNGFGTLHNANDEFLWYGPDSFRTTGDDWTESYRVHPVGILSAVELQCADSIE